MKLRLVQTCHWSLKLSFKRPEIRYGVPCYCVSDSDYVFSVSTTNWKFLVRMQIADYFFVLLCFLSICNRFVEIVFSLIFSLNFMSNSFCSNLQSMQGLVPFQQNFMIKYTESMFVSRNFLQLWYSIFYRHLKSTCICAPGSLRVFIFLSF